MVARRRLFGVVATAIATMVLFVLLQQVYVNHHVIADVAETGQPNPPGAVPQQRVRRPHPNTPAPGDAGSVNNAQAGAKTHQNDGGNIPNVASRRLGPREGHAVVVTVAPLPAVQQVAVAAKQEPAPALPNQPKPLLANNNKSDQLQRRSLPKFTSDSKSDALNPENTARRNGIRKMMKHAWDGYVEFAWGRNELSPISKSGVDGSFPRNLGATIVDAYDTLLIMGLNDEAAKAEEFLLNQLSFDQDVTVSVFETTIRHLGGMLSGFALTGKPQFRDKAVDLGRRLLHAFDTQYGLPNPIVNLKTGANDIWGWTGRRLVLSEFASMHLEFEYLSRISGDAVFAQKVREVHRFLENAKKSHGLLPNFYDPSSRQWSGSASIGALGDSAYEYLFKTWYLTSQQNLHDPLLALYHDVMNPVMSSLIHLQNSFAKMPGFDHLSCFAGGLFALSANFTDSNDERERYNKYAADITHSCAESYFSTPSGLGPEQLLEYSEGQSLNSERKFILRPETVESIFYMWRTTHKPMYRDWAWRIAEAIERNCKVASGGYSGVLDVHATPLQMDDQQQSFFLAETLKYLYLTFTDDDVLPITQWVFNTEAHPFPAA